MPASFTDKVKPYALLPVWIALYLIVAGFIGAMTREQIPLWYRALAKPPLNPPDFVFPVVWTTLYIMIAVTGWRLWRRRADNRVLFLFIFQTVMNWAWSYLFFSYHLLSVSFFWILGLDIAVAALIVLLWRQDRIASLLLTPYLLWISFASYLNFMIWQLN